MSGEPIVGSVDWLRKNAWFPCQYCEAADELTVHRAQNLAMWKGLTLCDDCWSGVDDESLPATWSDLDPFTPFACLEDK